MSKHTITLSTKMDPQKHIVVHFDAETTTQGEARHNRNIDEAFNNESVAVPGRRRVDGTQPEWMIMTGCARGSVDIVSIALNTTDTTIKGVDIRHQGDSVVKEIPIEEFVPHNFANMSRWLHSHGIPKELYQELLCCEVARYKWRSSEFKKRAIHDTHHKPDNCQVTRAHLQEHHQARVNELRMKCPDGLADRALEPMIDYFNSQLDHDINKYNQNKNPKVLFEPFSGERGPFCATSVTLDGRPVNLALQAVWTEAHGRV